MCIRDRDSLCLIVNSWTVALKHIVGRYTDGLAICTDSDSASSCLGAVGIDECIAKNSTNLLRLYRILELYHIVTTDRKSVV